MHCSKLKLPLSARSDVAAVDEEYCVIDGVGKITSFVYLMMNWIREAGI